MTHMPKTTRGIDQLAPVDSANLHQQAYGQLREAIMAGKFRPGESITLRGLAAALGTSIMPARDAVLRLVAERALESHGRSVRVPLLNIERLRDVERFRVALEGEAAALAAERATATQIDAIVQADARCQKAQASGRMDRFLPANQQFHFAIYAAAHSELLLSMIETLWLQIGPHLAYVANYSQDNHLGAIDMAHHRRLVDAIRTRDAAEARAALAADLKDSTDIYAPFREMVTNVQLPAPLRARG